MNVLIIVTQNSNVTEIVTVVKKKGGGIHSERAKFLMVVAHKFTLKKDDHPQYPHARTHPFLCIFQEKIKDMIADIYSINHIERILYIIQKYHHHILKLN